MESEPRRSLCPSTSKSCPFKPPPKQKLSKALPFYSPPRRPKRVFQPLSLVYGSYLAPSPTRKRRRTLQASVNPNPSLNKPAASSSPNCGALEPEFPIDDEPFDTGLPMPFTDCEEAENELPEPLWRPRWFRFTCNNYSNRVSREKPSPRVSWAFAMESLLCCPDHSPMLCCTRMGSS